MEEKKEKKPIGMFIIFAILLMFTFYLPDINFALKNRVIKLEDEEEKLEEKKEETPKVEENKNEEVVTICTKEEEQDEKVVSFTLRFKHLNNKLEEYELEEVHLVDDKVKFENLLKSCDNEKLTLDEQIETIECFLTDEVFIKKNIHYLKTTTTFDKPWKLNQKIKDSIEKSEELGYVCEK